MIFNNKLLKEISHELADLKLRLKQLSDNFEKHKEEIYKKDTEHSGSLSELSKMINQLQKNQLMLSSDFEKEIKKTGELNRLMEKRINSFKVIGDRASKKLIEDANLEIKSQLDGLFNLTNCYKELENGLLDSQSKVNLLVEEILKFKSISSEIKGADFELASYARTLTNADQEKLRLMRENDSLKRLISHERSRGRNR